MIVEAPYDTIGQGDGQAEAEAGDSFSLTLRKESG
jgi:hypothetical protein